MKINFPEFFFRGVNKATKLPTYRRNQKKISAKKKLLSYRATELPAACLESSVKWSYQATELLGYRIENKFSRIFFFKGVNKTTKLPTYQKKMRKKIRQKKSYQATYLLSYQHGKFFRLTKRVTKLPTYWATGGMSGGMGQTKYQATELLSYRHEKIFRNFFSEEKIKLPSYLPTEQKIWDSIHITCHIYHSPRPGRPRGSEGAKIGLIMRFFTFWSFRAPKRPVGAVLIKI